MPEREPWDAGTVRELRRALGMTQAELAAELGVRQQTVSEWETGAYRPRGASGRVLTLIADRAGLLAGAEPLLRVERDEWPAGEEPRSDGREGHDADEARAASEARSDAGAGGDGNDARGARDASEPRAEGEAREGGGR